MIPQQRMPYAMALRAVGAYLDDHDAQYCNVLEVVDGFAVRYQRADSELVVQTAHVNNDDVSALQAELEWRRSPQKRSRGESAVANSGGYQDFMRALGRELDDLEAWDVMLDELDDSFLITYLHLDPQHGFLARKHMLTLNTPQIQNVLQMAHARREIDPRDSRRFEGMPSTPMAMDWRQRAGKGKVVGIPWEVGERQIFRTELKNVWEGDANRDLGRADLALTNRRIALRLADGTIQRVPLDAIQDTRSAISRQLLTRHFRLLLQGHGLNLGLDCFEQPELGRLLSFIEEARINAAAERT
ncbi:MAG TPA: hypothetical protein VF898_01220 [Chloroflexota bacterium]